VAAEEPRSRVSVEERPQYPNMRRFVDAFPQIVEVAERAIRAEGLEPVKEPIRGGRGRGAARGALGGGAAGARLAPGGLEHAPPVGPGDLLHLGVAEAGGAD